MLKVNFKKINRLVCLIVVSAFLNTTNVLALTNEDITNLIKIMQDENNPLDDSIIVGDVNLIDNSMDNILLNIFSEPAVSDNYDKIGRCFSQSNIKGIKVFVDGQLIDFAKYDNVEPTIINNRTYVPIRAISESLGANVQWLESERAIKLTLLDTTIYLAIDSVTAKINDKEMILDTPAKIIAGRTVVPIRFISEAFAKTVEWHPSTSDVNVIAIY